jgi:hypothetical protein
MFYELVPQNKREMVPFTFYKNKPICWLIFPMKTTKSFLSCHKNPSKKIQIKVQASIDLGIRVLDI